METGDKSILLRIYQEKVQEKVLKDSGLEALKQFIDDGDADKANEMCIRDRPSNLSSGDRFLPVRVHVPLYLRKNLLTSPLYR